MGQFGDAVLAMDVSVINAFYDMIPLMGPLIV